MCILPVYFEGTSFWCFLFLINILPFIYQKKRKKKTNVSCKIIIIKEVRESLAENAQNGDGVHMHMPLKHITQLKCKNRFNRLQYTNWCSKPRLGQGRSLLS